ncbi:CAP domain-containing protein [Pedobacter sp. N23S346]|uniref:CAP domain-containing protein n=1 Tax=Pedobacter sp. N23S346 TaxID=3402750 RepID=UPI003AC43C27
MIKQVLTAFLIFSSAVMAHAQSWTDAEYQQANTAANVPYLSSEEKNIVLYMNLARIDGEKFYDTIIEDYIDDYNLKVRKYRNYNDLKISKNNPYYLSLLKHLRGIKNLPMFYPDDKLSMVSRNHALDLNRNNLDTHESSNGEKFSKRISKYYPSKTMSENIDFGNANGLEIVCHLLLDCGVPSLGHRLTILDQKSRLNMVGISIQRHPSYNWCAVIDYVANPGNTTPSYQNF